LVNTKFIPYFCSKFEKYMSLNANDIRETFLQFFKNKQHTIIPSAPMVIKNDPTLLFTNAGMNQFKEWFLGNTPITHLRIADTQKCLRVSGKHNDLEEVGHDTYHHTMFEMLGNWSFGDYFKKEAIAWAWELLTEVYKVDKNRLYVTVFEGSHEDALEADLEALEHWKTHIPEARILMGSRKDNFWEMGAVGPCGPCSEIHIDLRHREEQEKIDGATLVNSGHPQVVEIWNLVFMQFNRKADGSLEQLPKKHVDTGMGFERLCMALQGKQSNYDTDVFQPLIIHIAELCGKKYGDDIKSDIAMRVIADHLRAVCFSIADGQLPSNVKAGYVIRRILRRAVRYGYTFLHFNEPFIYRLTPTLIKQMGEAFPELQAQQALIEKVIFEEEHTFLRTLEKGIQLLDSIIEKNIGNKEISGKDAFLLYDTFGFPIDLTELIAREKGVTINFTDFEKELEAQKNRSRNAAAKEEGDWIDVNTVSHIEFTGYDTLTDESHIVRYRTVKEKNKETIQVVLDRTPFYAESGGQTGDSGTLTDKESNSVINVLNTIKENNLCIHIVNKLPENLYATFTASVHAGKRMATACNHTATHLLHYALRQILGTHVEQKGSLVNPEYLRFDFSHFQKISDEELSKIEALVNALVRQNIPLCEMRKVPVAEAQKMGAMALFGEKYGDEVRVIRYGDSVELCGGTHLPATGHIGYFKIISESSSAAGIRRIEAITAEKAEKTINEMLTVLKMAHSLFSSPNLLQAVKKTLDENTELSRQVENYTREKIAYFKERVQKEIQEINGIKVIRLQVNISADALKILATQIRVENPDALFAGITLYNDKPTLIVALGDNLTARGLNAANIVKEAAKEMGGSGGGQTFIATAGGKDVQKADKAIDKAIALVVS
jgi:alanyl-tRNA synthetase